MPEPVDLTPPSLDDIRRHLDALNRRFVAMSADLDRINNNVADLIGEDSEHYNLERNAD